MNNHKKDLKGIIEELVQEIKARAARKGQTIDPKPHMPAGEEQLKAYEKYLGINLPPLYREFLELHNGYTQLLYTDDMFSIEDVMPGGSWHDRIQAWKKDIKKQDIADLSDVIVLANLGEPNNWVYIDPHRIGADGEMEVCRILTTDQDFYKDLIEFLRSRVKYMKTI